ncbi:RDD family protein [Pseudoalteromonas carrageenovora]|uniref:RDD family protein n=1 Tax=Pseudoalteromonas carrageenovora TaxID=227 RepID=UPI0026E39B93|nr:RDD family protein [Pseudoalteromonas carrageenovora]MDO6547561.1 RDD family protein [Pseudoalteromonas carrageenovora]MDO6831879.1 RDD family protein [Pseudoalteromonas carrageenovora]
MKAKEIEQLALSDSETKDVITPYAFKIDQALLGIPLATPIKRAMAMIIDVTLIFMAAKLSATLIAFVAAMAFYKGTAQQYLPKMSSFWRRALKLFAASFLFVSALTMLSLAIDFFEDDNAIQGIQIEKAQRNDELSEHDKSIIRTYLAQTGDGKNCDDVCQSVARANLVSQLPALAEIEDVGGIEVTRTLLHLMAIDDEPIAADDFKNNNTELKSISGEVADESNITEKAGTKSEKTKPVTSILQWGKGIIQDLGLGFGWAAVYFTLFSLLWRGQTPGKKVFNIRVVALSGEPLGMLDCFGRYGGYGAGFATGLLGFLQVYWDPNRQAIQDKISATVVIQGSVNQVVNAKTVEETVKS